MINLHKPLLSLDGKESDITLGKLLASRLAAATKGEPIKMYDWALALYNGKPISPDRSDTEFLISFVREDNLLTNLSKAQILTALKDEGPN